MATHTPLVSTLALLSPLIATGCMGTEPPPSAALQAMHARCVEEMLNSTCRVLPEGGGLPVIPREGEVFVAGAGRIDASALQALRQAGEAMCEAALRACTEDLESPRCQAARKLWRADIAPQAPAGGTHPSQGR